MFTPSRWAPWDYVVKPFSSAELVARIRAAMQRRADGGHARPLKGYSLGELTIDHAEHRVSVGGRQVQLTATEYKLLLELSIEAGRVLTHEQLLRRVWGPEHSGDPRLVRTSVKTLRRKLGDDAASPRYIITAPRVGYSMAKPETAMDMKQT